MLFGIYKKIITAFVFATILFISNYACAAGMNAFEAEVFNIINRYRSGHGLALLAVDENLQVLAREHSKEMYRSNLLSHQNFKARFRKSGRRICVENAGLNSPTPHSQFVGWRDSSGHRVNMLDRRVKYAGISKFGPYVTFFACN
jgi:uncharacterized protein YkwD